MMTADCKMRILLIVFISLATGFVSSVVLDSIFMTNYAENLFTQESMQDTLWLEYDGYNEYSNINSLKSIHGVDSIGVQIGMYSSHIAGNILAISESLLSRMRIPVSAGKWDFSVLEPGILPAVVSYNFAKKNPVGTTMQIRVESGGKNDALPITIKVIGVLNEIGGLPRLNVGQFISNPSLRNILYWHNLRNTIVIPLDTLARSNELSNQIDSVITIHMTDEIAHSDDNIVALQETLYEKGFGFTNTGFYIVRRAKDIESFSSGRYQLMIYLFMVLTVAGVICYNIAFSYHKRRDIAVLRLLGVTKRGIALNWMFIIGYSHILPMIVGLSLGQCLLSNGQAYFLHQLQIRREAIVIGVIIILLATYALSYRFLSKDISSSIKEDQ